MRKAQKQQAQELVRQMEEAHDQFRKFIEQGSIPPAMELLEECQNGGITLGTLIEDTEGEGHPTVSRRQRDQYEKDPQAFEAETGQNIEQPEK